MPDETRTIPTSDDPVVGWLWQITVPTRATCDRPLTMQWRGEPWTLATNGHVLAMRPGDFAFEGVRDCERFANVIGAAPTSEPRAFPLAEVRVRLAPPTNETPLPHCDTCDDTGKVDCDACDGDGGVECECHCGHLHEIDCETCKGKGWTPCTCGRMPADDPPIVPWRIGDGLFNRHLLAKVSPLLPDAPATWQQDKPESPALLVVGEWRVFLMPLRQNREWTVEHTVELESLAASAPRSAR